MTEKAQNTDFCRKPQSFADSPLLLEIQAFGGRRKPQKTADFRRKPKIFAENRRKPQIGLRHLRCVTFSSALENFTGMRLFLIDGRGDPKGRELTMCCQAARAACPQEDRRDSRQLPAAAFWVHLSAEEAAASGFWKSFCRRDRLIGM